MACELSSFPKLRQMRRASRNSRRNKTEFDFICDFKQPDGGGALSHLRGSRLTPTYFLPTFHLSICFPFFKALSLSHNLSLYYHHSLYSMKYFLYCKDHETKLRLSIRHSGHRPVSGRMKTETQHF